MKISLIINDHLTEEQLEHSYLLCLAWLNFEHQVNVIFMGQTFESIMQNTTIKKQWLALKQYGVEAFYLLDWTNKHVDETTKQHCQMIDLTTFDHLKSEMDLLL